MRHVILSVAVMLVLPRLAAASPSEPAQQQEPVWIEVVAARCDRYLTAMPETDNPFAWNQYLSLAGCMQDATVASVGDAEDLEPLVQDLSRGLAPAILLYLEALKHGPGTVQLRAAYQVGAAYAALITRARASLRSGTAHETRVELEGLLARAKKTAWISFAVVVRASEQDRSLAPDPVTRNMVRSARALLPIFSDSVQPTTEAPLLAQ